MSSEYAIISAPMFTGLSSMLASPPMRNAAIKAVDALSDKLDNAAGKPLAKLVSMWKTLDRTQKEQVISVVIATTTAAVAAIAAARSRSPGKRAARKARKVVKRARKQL